MKIIKTGIAIKKELIDKLDEIMKILNIDSRSKAISEAVEMYIAEKSSLFGQGVLNGVILLLYDHTIRKLEHELTHVQHEYLDLIVSTTHIHLDKTRCLEAIIVKGSIKKIRNLIGQLEKLRGVHVVRHMFFRSRE